MSEVWKPLLGWPYTISNFGRVRNSEGRELAKRKCRRELRLKYKSRTRREYIATLVLEVFIGPRPTKNHLACHKNDKAWDDRLSNLKWGTKRTNAKDAIDNGILGKGSPTARKISSALKGRRKPPFSKLHRQRIGDAQRGRKNGPPSQAVIDKIRCAQLGIPKSKDHRRKVSKGLKRAWKEGRYEGRRVSKF